MADGPQIDLSKTPRVLVLGGARSGKSRFAERLAEDSGYRPVYLATAEAGDDEMAERIARHRDRRGPEWVTVEEPLDLGGALKAHSRPDRVMVVDCLTLWLTNVMLGGHDIQAAAEYFYAVLANTTAPTVLISNEVGLGIVPDNALSRRFRDEAGRLHQETAQIADAVVFVAAGLPLILKPQTA